jgi:hypothetical protein
MAVLVQQRVNLWKSGSVADKTKRITRFRDAIDDVAEAVVYRWLAAGKTQLVDPAALPVLQDLFQDCQRQIAGRGMPLVKTVAAAQVAVVG